VEQHFGMEKAKTGGRHTVSNMHLANNKLLRSKILHSGHFAETKLAAAGMQSSQHTEGQAAPRVVPNRNTRRTKRSARHFDEFTVTGNVFLPGRMKRVDDDVAGEDGEGGEVDDARRVDVANESSTPFYLRTKSRVRKAAQLTLPANNVHASNLYVKSSFS